MPEIVRLLLRHRRATYHERGNAICNIACANHIAIVIALHFHQDHSSPKIEFDILISFTEYRTSVLLAHANDCRCNFFLRTTVSSIADVVSRISNRFIPDIPRALTYYFLKALRTLFVPDTSNLSRDTNHAVLVEDFHGGRMLATSFLVLAVQVNNIKRVHDLRDSVANFRAAANHGSSASRIPTLPILLRASTSSSHSHRVVQDAQPAAQS